MISKLHFTIGIYLKFTNWYDPKFTNASSKIKKNFVKVGIYVHNRHEISLLNN